MVGIIIDAIIINKDRPKETTLTIECLKLTNSLGKIILIDNGSKKTSYLNKVRADKIIKLDSNVGQARALNIGLKHTKSKYVLFIHNDVIICEWNWIKKAVNFLEENKDVGLISLIGGLGDGKIVSSLYNIRVTHPDAFSYFGDNNFIQVRGTDSVANIFLNLGIKADERFGLAGIDYFREYLKLGYKIYTMKVSNAIHLRGSTLNYEGKEYKEQIRLAKKVRKIRIKEFDSSNDNHI